VASPLLNAIGEPGRGLTAMTFENGVEYREEAGKATTARVARARTLTAALSADSTIEQADFSDGFRFEDGKLVATSANAVYQVTKGTLALRGPGGSTSPHVADERMTLDAETIDVTLAPRVVHAAGKVSAQFTPGRRPGERGTTLLSDTEPVLVTAAKFAFDEQSGSGIYSGKPAILFQAKSGTQIRGDSITVNEKVGTLTALGNVVTTLPIAGKTEGGGKGTSLARAGEFQFDDAKRRAVFIKQAQFDGVQGNVRADRIELVLAPQDNTLERLEGEGAVTALVEKRTATGQKLTYHPGDERYVLAGTPVRLVEGCRESTGRTLTFYRASARILVDGNEETRVQTKGGDCPESGDREIR
jgi:lipopolysaccharide export system protein LptA